MKKFIIGSLIAGIALGLGFIANKQYKDMLDDLDKML